MGSIPITRSGPASPLGAFETDPRLLSREDVQHEHAAVAQLVERVLGKDEVLGSNPSGSFRARPKFGWSVGPRGQPQAIGTPARIRPS